MPAGGRVLRLKTAKLGLAALFPRKRLRRWQLGLTNAVENQKCGFKPENSNGFRCRRWQSELAVFLDCCSTSRPAGASRKEWVSPPTYIWKALPTLAAGLKALWPVSIAAGSNCWGLVPGNITFQVDLDLFDFNSLLWPMIYLA